MRFVYGAVGSCHPNLNSGQNYQLFYGKEAGVGFVRPIVLLSYFVFSLGWRATRIGDVDGQFHLVLHVPCPWQS